MSRLLINQQKKIISFILAIFLFFSMYIYLEYRIIKSETIEQLKKSIVLEYDIYVQMLKNDESAISLLIENRDYIDTKEFIDEYKKSTPLFKSNIEERVSQYSFSLEYFDKNSKRENLKSYVSLLEKESEDYYVKFTASNKIILFASVLDKGYILIYKDIKADNKILERIEFFFIFICILFLISILFFFYMISLKKNLSNLANDLKRNYEVLSEETKKVAFEDTLTKAASRLKFDETLKDLIQVASRFEEQRFSIIMLDIDNFKAINDTYGHDYGDIVLKEVARTSKLSLRSSDTFARWGGEEFIVICPFINLQDACKIAEKLRKLISDINFEKIGNITCSFGVTEFRQGDCSETIIKRADNLLYQAKENGKNIVEFKEN